LLLLLMKLPFRVCGFPEDPSEDVKKLTISGYVRDQSSGEILIGANVSVIELNTGVVTNQYGFYSVTFSPGHYTLRFSHVGFEVQEKRVYPDRNLVVDVNLLPVSEVIREVVVTGKRSGQDIRAPEMNLIKIDTKSIGRVPALLGEVDLIKVIQLLPGVQPTSEGSSGFSVRGGNADQNLILLDEATIYNASHLMGFFSVFNNDAIKDVTLYKGDMPAAYGGRLSSLLDVRLRDGNARKFTATGSVGTVSSKITLEGPVIKDRTTCLFSGRRTYADLFLPLAKKEEVRGNRLYFYDLNFKISHRLDKKNKFFLTGYSGRDIFKNRFAVMGFGNQTASIRWNHLFSSKLFANLSLITSGFSYNLGTDEKKENAFTWNSNIYDQTVRADITIYPGVNHTIRTGGSAVYHRFYPGRIRATRKESLFQGYSLQPAYAYEHGLYVSEETRLSESFTVKAGFRLSMFLNSGPGTFYKLDENYMPTDSTRVEGRSVYHTWVRPEPRLAFTWMLSKNASVKGGYSRTVQFMMLAQNSTAGTPLDIWFPASPNVKPQTCDQYSAGFFRNSLSQTFEISAEAYCKLFRNVIDFKDHARLLLNRNLEGELRFGRGTAFGIETMVRKNLGYLTGWMSYTFSRSFRTVPEINGGKKYNAPFDKPHTVNVVASYDPGGRIAASLTWLYATGLPVTFPTGRAFVGNALIPVYSDRNQYRFQDYHRMDISLTLRGKNKPGRDWKGEWNLSVYNIYNRHNTWSVNFVQDEASPNMMVAEKTYLFSVIPALTYQFKF